MVFAMYVSWNDYIYAFIFINSPENTMLNISLMKIALGGSQFEMKWGSLTAGSIVSFLPIKPLAPVTPTFIPLHPYKIRRNLLSAFHTLQLLFLYWLKN